jgi:LPPG:FO 2-phospho-L-lactate transferase
MATLLRWDARKVQQRFSAVSLPVYRRQPACRPPALPRRGGRPCLPGPPALPRRAARAGVSDGVRCAGGDAGCKTAGMRITVLAGGVGAARFLRGLRAAAPGAEITVIGNTGDDIILFGLHISPDLDTVMYTLGGGISEDRGWGRDGETFAVLPELAAYGAGPDWFTLGDRDIATHITRTALLRDGATLSRATARLCERWQPGVTLLPMSDDPVRTHVVLGGEPGPGGNGGGIGGGERTVHFQEWWVRLRAAVPARQIIATGAAQARPAPGVLAAIEAADCVLFPPSNPVVSIGTILAVPGIAAAVAARPVVGVSPIIGGAPVHGMADACLTAIGVPTTAAAVAAHYGASRHGPGLLDGWLVDEQDKAATAAPELDGIEVRALPLYMTDVAATARIARAALDLAAEVAR